MISILEIETEILLTPYIPNIRDFEHESNYTTLNITYYLIYTI